MSNLLLNKSKAINFFKKHLAKHSIMANKYNTIEDLLNLANFKYDSDKIQNGKLILNNSDGAFTAYVTSDFGLDSSTVAYIKNSLNKITFDFDTNLFSVVDDTDTKILSGTLSVKRQSRNLNVICLTADVAFDTIFKSDVYDLDILRLQGLSLFNAVDFSNMQYIYKNEDLEACLLDINNKSYSHADTSVDEIDEDHFIVKFVDNIPVISQFGIPNDVKKSLRIDNKVVIDADVIFYHINLYISEYGRLYINEKSNTDYINMYQRGADEAIYGQNVLVFDTCDINICDIDDSTGVKLASEAVINCNDNHSVIINNSKINAKFYNEGLVMYDELNADQELLEVDEMDKIEPQLNVWKNLEGSDASSSTLNDTENPRLYGRSVRLAKVADQDKPVAIKQTFKITPNKLYVLNIHRKGSGIANADLNKAQFNIYPGIINSVDELAEAEPFEVSSNVSNDCQNRPGWYKLAGTRNDTRVNNSNWTFGANIFDAGNNEYATLVLYNNSNSGQVNFGPMTVSEYSGQGIIYTANTDVMVKDTDIVIHSHMSDFAKSKLRVDSVNTAADRTKEISMVDAYGGFYYILFVDDCTPRHSSPLSARPIDDPNKPHVLCMDSVTFNSKDLMQGTMFGLYGYYIKTVVQRCKMQIDNQWVSKYGYQEANGDYDYQMQSPTSTTCVQYSWNYWKDNYITANSASGYDGGCGAMWSNSRSHNWVYNIEAHGMRDGLSCSSTTYFNPDGTHRVSTDTYFPDGTKVENPSYNYIMGGFISSPGHGGLYAAGSARQVKPDQTIDKTNGRSEGIKYDSTKVYVMDCDVCWRVKSNEPRYTGAAGTYCGYGTDTWFDNCTVGLRTSPGYNPGGTIVLNNRGSSEIKKGTRVFFSNSYNRYGFRNDPNSTTYVGKGCSGKLTGTNTTASGGEILNTDEVYRIEVPEFPF